VCAIDDHLYQTGYNIPARKLDRLVSVRHRTDILSQDC